MKQFTYLRRAVSLPPEWSCSTSWFSLSWQGPWALSKSAVQRPNHIVPIVRRAPLSICQHM